MSFKKLHFVQFTVLNIGNNVFYILRYFEMFMLKKMFTNNNKIILTT